MRKHAFLLLVHNQPILLRHLLTRLQCPSHYFFIHVDKRVDLNPFKEMVSDVPQVFFLQDRKACNWGGNNMVWATLELLKTAQGANDFAYYHLVSGTDAFCSTNKEFDSFFENNCRNYIAKLPNSSEYEWREKIYGLENFLSRRKKWGDFVCRNVIKVQRKVQKFVPLRKGLPKEIVYCKGSQWWSLHSSMVQYILNFLKNNHWYLECFSNSFCSDEAFFQTLVYNSPLKENIVSNNLRYIDWSPKYPKENLPRILNESDFAAIISSGKFFCRKMDENKSRKLMEMIDSAS